MSKLPDFETTFDFRTTFSTMIQFDSNFLRLRFSLRVIVKFYVRYSEKPENSQKFVSGLKRRKREP
jgi:hypothetical protein